MTIEELLARAKRLRNELDDSNARLDRQCGTAMYEMEQALQSQAERIAELERESETHSKAYGLAIVERDNLRHELKVAQEGWRCECSTDDACRFARERDTLRAQLAAIAATEPVSHQFQTVGGGWHPFLDDKHYQNTKDDGRWPIRELFTRPMPAQDVTELVEALQWLKDAMTEGDQSDVNHAIAKCFEALSKYKGAK